MLAVLVRGVGVQGVEQRLGAEDVVAHRRERLVRAAGQPGRVGGLLQERLDLAAVVRGLDHAERGGLAARHGDAGDGHPGAAVEVLLPHLPRVHPVDVVRAEDDDQVRALVVDQVQRLEDRVRRAGVPARAEPLLRGHGRDVVAQQVRQPPGHRDVPVEAVALVLGEYRDPAGRSRSPGWTARSRSAGRDRRRARRAWPGRWSAGRAVCPRRRPGRCPGSSVRPSALLCAASPRAGGPGGSRPILAEDRSAAQRRGASAPAGRWCEFRSCAPDRVPVHRESIFSGSGGSAGLCPRRPVCGNRPPAPYESKQ